MFLFWSTFRAVALSTFFIGVTLFFPDAANAVVRGSCDTYLFEEARNAGVIDAEGKIQRAGAVIVIRQGAPVLESENTSSSISTTKEFGAPVYIKQREGSMFRVENSGGQILGWMHGEDLLCLPTPVTSPRTGLDQKFFVKTATALRKDGPQFVSAYPDPKSENCEINGGRCRQLGRFEQYWVFAYDTESDRFFLGDNYTTADSFTAIGWVDRESGFLWETAFGVRPKEELVFPANHELAGQERAICVYDTEADALNGTKSCPVPVLGGYRWFKRSIRMPILGKNDDGTVFHVALPVAGKGGLNFDDTRDKLVRKIQELANIDVLFVIDGTRSMRNHIKAIVGSPLKPGIVQTLQQRLAEDESFSGVRIRYGFRVYRDSFAGKGNVGEGLALSANCNADEVAYRNELQAFENAIARVEVSDNDKAAGDDIPENVFGGIFQGFDDLLNCPENQKLMIVVGDHGYDAAAQQRKTGRSFNTDQLVALLGRSAFRKRPPIVPFFLQAPLEAGASDKALAAHEDFAKQGEKIVREVISKAQDGLVERENPRELDLRMSDYTGVITESGLVDRILDGVKKFSNQRVINEVAADVRGGAAFVDIVDSLSSSDEFGNLPGLFWNVLELKVCSENPKACEENVVDVIKDGYVRNSDDLEVEVLLKGDSLRQWIEILGSIRVNLTDTETTRREFNASLIAGVAKVLGEPTIQDTKEPVADYLVRRGGLPVSDSSPLQKYDFQALADSVDGVLDCEISLIGSWLRSSKTLLQMVEQRYIPVFELTEINKKICDTTEHLRLINGTIAQRAFPEPNMSWSRPVKNTLVWWVPTRFLP